LIKNDNLAEEILVLKYVSDNDGEVETENVPVTYKITSRI
jgi:hypothetical protein